MGECVLLAASSSWGSTDRKVWELLLQGNLGTSAHMEQCRGVLVAAGSRAECASVSSVFGFVCLNANEEKIISSREALYQLLLGGKKPNPTVSAGLSSLLHTALQGAAPCKGTGKGMCGLCPGLCTVLGARTPFCLSVPFLFPKAGVVIMCRISGKFITHKVPVGL